jgi:hypothetical protein
VLDTLHLKNDVQIFVFGEGYVVLCEVFVKETEKKKQKKGPEYFSHYPFQISVCEFLKIIYLSTKLRQIHP